MVSLIIILNSKKISSSIKMNFDRYKIGYAPYSVDCKVPGDRRRFAFYAREKKLQYGLADPSNKYDIVYITASSNISKWIDYKQKHPDTKLIFEIIDFYLAEEKSVLSILKGITRYLTRKDKRFYLNYKNAFKDIIRIADAVVCSTPIQYEYISRYNKNVHVSLDYFSDDITYHKTELKKNKKLKLVWEGQSYTVKNLLELNEVFKALAEKVELHIITDPEIKYPFKIFNKKTEEVLKPLNCTYYLHNWQRETFSKIISESDLAIIPMDLNDKLVYHKPENKLLLLWEIGIPVLTSETPAYKRVMDEAGLNYCCNNITEWINKIQSFINRPSQQNLVDVKKANLYLEKRHSKKSIMESWDKILLSVLD
jgi:hypothetical protein